MYTLGIETSCDETAVAVVENGTTVRSSCVSSSVNMHRKFGGIIPEIASRYHLEYINDVAAQALREASLRLDDIGLIAVTSHPGLMGSLLVGVSFAKALSFGRGIPLIGVNHLHAHLFAPFLNQRGYTFPFIGLVVSGGHTSLAYVSAVDRIRIIGQTRDDAAGEAYDKVAKLLELGYPGGPVVDRLAGATALSPFRFNCGRIKDSLDFSFSGIKTDVMYRCRALGHTSKTVKAQICRAFQEEVVAVLVEKSLAACRQFNVNRLSVGGGVTCNSSLRQRLQLACREHGITLLLSEPRFCIDNAAMIASLGYHLFRRGKRSPLTLTPAASARPRRR